LRSKFQQNYSDEQYRIIVFKILIIKTVNKTVLYGRFLSTDLLSEQDFSQFWRKAACVIVIHDDKLSKHSAGLA